MFRQLDFSWQRKRMVEEQLKARDIVDKKVLKVMSQIPREEFVPPELQNQAYADGPLPIGENQTISQPYIVALMTQLLELKGGEKILEIGTGSGYQAAVLAKLAKMVYTIERKKKLLEQAKKKFNKLKLENIKTRLGDGTKGWLQKAPFQAIIVTAATNKVPLALTEQLAEGGRLVMPLGGSFGQELVRLIKKRGQLIQESFGGCAFVPLVGGENEV